MTDKPSAPRMWWGLRIAILILSAKAVVWLAVTITALFVCVTTRSTEYLGAAWEFFVPGATAGFVAWLLWDHDRLRRRIEEYEASDRAWFRFGRVAQ